VPPTLREFDLSGTKPILPRRRKRELSSTEAFASEEFGPRLPSHSIRPGRSRSSAVPSPGVASRVQRHLRINSTPSVVRRRTTGRRARILRIRVSRGHLTPVPLPSSLGALDFNNLPMPARNQCRSSVHCRHRGQSLPLKVAGPRARKQRGLCCAAAIFNRGRAGWIISPILSVTRPLSWRLG